MKIIIVLRKGERERSLRSADKQTPPEIQHPGLSVPYDTYSVPEIENPDISGHTKVHNTFASYKQKDESLEKNVTV